MEFQQVDIKVNDFLLRIKHDGEWIRLDTDFMQEADDYHLDISDKLDIEALDQLQNIFSEEIKKYKEIRKSGQSIGAWKVFEEVKERFASLGRGDGGKDEN